MNARGFLSFWVVFGAVKYKRVVIVSFFLINFAYEQNLSKKEGSYEKCKDGAIWWVYVGVS